LAGKQTEGKAGGAACKNPAKPGPDDGAEPPKAEAGVPEKAAPEPPKAEAGVPEKAAPEPPKAEAGVPEKAAPEPPKAEAGVPEKAEEEEPEPRSYTPEEIEEISRRAESYRDSTPPYEPTRVLSPEYGGTSSYERGIDEFRGQKAAELERLRADPDSPRAALEAAEEGVRTLDRLYENYHLGMNVFRTAKGGRSKLRE